MTPFEQRDVLASMTLLVDTREQDTKKLRDRLEIIGLPYRRQALDVGDYSCACTMSDGVEMDFSSHAVIERKYGLEELCMCFGSERQRFEREFERAKDKGIRVYLLVENATWEKVLNGKYDSKFNANALTGSILAWEARYDVHLEFCKTETTGRLIRQILYRELREWTDREVQL